MCYSIEEDKRYYYQYVLVRAPAPLDEGANALSETFR